MRHVGLPGFTVLSSEGISLGQRTKLDGISDTAEWRKEVTHQHGDCSSKNEFLYHLSWLLVLVPRQGSDLRVTSFLV